MKQLGHALPRLIHAMATASPSDGPLFFAKWDIKDGFGCLVVSPEHAWHFCYVLPGSKSEPIQLVVSSWCESPAFFCTASKTARDIAQQLLANPAPLLPHPLENMCLPPVDTFPQIQDSDFTQLLQLLEVYVDDFIGLIQAPQIDQAKHFTWAVLHAIHSVFPPAAITKHPNDEPIALKKLATGNGIWATHKEILCWLFDGLA